MQYSYLSVLYVQQSVDNVSLSYLFHCFTVQSLTQTMCLICELLTEEPEGARDTIPFETFKELYTYLAQMNCSSGKHQDAGILLFQI
jgi:hypothetical protein